MRLPPPDVVATWPPPNYESPETRGPTLIIVEIITLSLALICLGLRLYVRSTFLDRTELDDWMMVGGAFFGTAMTACVVLAFVRFGWDVHVWDLTFDRMVAGRQVSFAAQALFVFATSLAKISILVSYLRFAPLRTWFRRLTFAGIWFVGLLNVAFLVVLFTQCVPISSYWKLEHNARDCAPEAPSLLAQATTTALADFIVWVLPIPSFFTTGLPLAQRLAVITLFSFGLLVVFAACIRTYWIHYVVQETYDVTWVGFHLWMWTAVEVHLGIMCGCVPWLKSLIRFWRMRNAPIVEVTDKVRRMEKKRRQKERLKAAFKVGTVVRSKSVGKRANEDKERDKGLDLEKGISQGTDGERERERKRDTFPDLESCSSTKPILSDSTPGLAL